jgi:hypothetical protein
MPLCGWNDDMANGLALFVTGSINQPAGETYMAWCGHNEKMADGLGSFAGGLVRQTNQRAKEENVPVSSIPVIEMEEIDALLEELQSSSHRQSLAGVMAVGQLIRHFYAELGEALARDPAKSVEQVFGEKVAELNRLLFAMEEYYYNNLRPYNPRLVAIRLIRGFLEERVGK